MSIDKTLTDKYRRDLTVDKIGIVYDALPAHFDSKYPNLIKFLEEYFKSFEENNNPAEKVNDLLTSRDVQGAKVELLDFIANELLLGKPYYEGFEDKRTSLQFSNLLYRSKGTEFSIKQFFRVFFGLDIDVRYGKDEIFYVGDPEIETQIFSGLGASGTSNYPYTFKGSTHIVSMTDSDGEYVQLRQDTDYLVNFSQQLIELQALDSAGIGLDSSDSKLLELATTGLVPTGSNLKIFSTTRSQTLIGSDITFKKLTNAGFYQLYGLLISAPIGVSTWRDAYKTFVHPAGMFLAGEVSILDVFDLGIKGATIIEPPPPIEIVARAPVNNKRGGLGIYTTSITEIGPGPYGDRIRSRVNDMFNPRNIDNWHTQYGSIADADDINGRTLDDTYADLSNIINRLDEGRWYGYDSDGSYHSNDSDGLGNQTALLGDNEQNLIQYVEYPNLIVGDPGD
jgi:hypothetical protein